MLENLRRFIKKQLWIRFTYIPWFEKNRIYYAFLAKQDNFDFLCPNIANPKMPRAFLQHLITKKMNPVIDSYDFCKVCDPYLRIDYVCAYDLILTFADDFGIQNYQEALDKNNQLKSLFVGFLQIRGIVINANLVGSHLDLSRNQLTLRLAVNPLGLSQVDNLENEFKNHLEYYFFDELQEKNRLLDKDRKSKLK